MRKLINFIRYINTENIKTIFQLKTGIMFLLILLLTLGLSAISTGKKDSDWRKSAEEQISRIEKNKADDLKRFKENEKDDSAKKMFEFSLSMYESDLKVLKYCLDKNIPYNVVTPWKFAYDSSGIIGLIIIFLLVQASNIISNEYSMGTIKQLLIRPLKRWKIVLGKYISIMMTSMLFLLFLFGISYLIGNIVFFTTIVCLSNLSMSLCAFSCSDIFGSVPVYTFSPFILVISSLSFSSTN